jgi:hypothetical protein
MVLAQEAGDQAVLDLEKGTLDWRAGQAVRETGGRAKHAGILKPIET